VDNELSCFCSSRNGVVGPFCASPLDKRSSKVTFGLVSVAAVVVVSCDFSLVFD
jgi:hypothetical protein